ncbi:MAG: glycosyltransferase family 4 protein [Candidatus Methanoperedens sp.]
MKILMINSGAYPIPSNTGTENHVYYLSNALYKLGHEINIVSDIDTSVKFNGINVTPINFPESHIFNIKLPGYMFRHFVGGLLAFKNARGRFDYYDIVHVHGRLAPFLTTIFKNTSPVIFTVHDDPPVKLQPNYLLNKISYKLLQENAAKKADFVIATSDNIIKYLGEKVSSDKITKIENGVDTEIFKLNNGIQSDNSCIFVGSLTKRKGVQYLLKAIQNINIKCNIVGEGQEKNTLLKLSYDLGLSDKVKFLGNVPYDDLVRCYQKSSIFVLPSFNETTCISMLEAMACGKPVIVTKVGDIPNIIKDGYNGFLVEIGNANQVEEKLRLLIDNPDLRKEMGRNARLTVMKRYTWDIIAKKVIDVYDTVLKR